MARQQSKAPATCVVVIPLKGTSIEIVTSAAHALEIVQGETPLPSTKVKVFDRDGNPLTKRKLAALQVVEAGSLATNLLERPAPKAKPRKLKKDC